MADRDDLNRDDLTLPDADPRAISSAGATPPSALGPRDELDRYAWASAAIDAHPELLDAWSRSAEWASDRPVRRAIFRSPALLDPVAERILRVRRSGVHTLGSNPVVGRSILRSNPAALRTRDRIDEVVPGGLDEVRSDPNRPELIQLGSPTIDLVIARTPATLASTAEGVIHRETPRCDPWTHAVLVARFGVILPPRGLRRRVTERILAAALAQWGDD